jgi:hypothetical protein
MLRSLIEGFHSGRCHSQRQRCIETTKLQLYQLETICSSELVIREQVIELFWSSNRTVVPRRVVGTECMSKLGVIPVRQLVVRSG